MKRQYTYDYPRPALATDAAIFGYDGEALHLLLLQRATDPYKGKWALPGGYLHIDETTEEAVRRVLLEKTGVDKLYLEQLYTFSKTDRDPRERVISVAYYALVRSQDFSLVPGRITDKAEWFPVDKLPKLAFDHNEIVAMALERLRGKLRWQPVGFELLPAAFTLTQLQRLYEAVLGETLDKRNFRKKMQGMELLKATGKMEQDVARKPAQYYSFDKKKYNALAAKGFSFEL